MALEREHTTMEAITFPVPYSDQYQCEETLS
jgi:hypothetical protein